MTLRNASVALGWTVKECLPCCDIVHSSTRFALYLIGPAQRFHTGVGGFACMFVDGAGEGEAPCIGPGLGEAMC